MSSFLFVFSFFCWGVGTFASELALNWKPEPEFGGFYEALEKGWYQKQGIPLKILPGGAGQPVAQLIAAKKVRFGIVSADELMIARSQKMPIKAVFAVYQDNPQGILVKSTTPVNSLKDIFQSSMTVAIQKGMPYALWLERKYKPIKARLVPYAGGVAQLVEDQKGQFAQQGFIFSEPLVAKKLGVETKTFLISESGFNPYVAVVAVHEDTLKNSRSEVKAFVEASYQGWVSYQQDPVKTNQVMAKLNTSMALDTFHEAAKAQKKFVFPEGSAQKIGEMTQVRWSQSYQQLQDVKVIKSGLNPADFFENVR